MIGPLDWIGRRATTLLAGGVFLGLVFPDLAALARPLLVPTIVAMLAAALLRLDSRAVGALLRRPWGVLVASGFLLLVSPLIGFGAATLLGLEGGARTALVVWTASPPLISVAAIAMIVGLDGALALGITIVCGLLVAVTLPPIVLLLIGLDLDISVLALSARLLALLLLAAGLAWLMRILAGPARLERNAASIDGAFVIVMLIFAVSVMDGVTAAAQTDPWRVARLLAIVFGAAIGFQLLTLLLFLPAGRRTAGSIALSAGNRNMALVLGAAPSAFDAEVFLYLALLQFPIYLLPALLKPVYRRLA